MGDVNENGKGVGRGAEPGSAHDAARQAAAQHLRNVFDLLGPALAKHGFGCGVVVLPLAGATMGDVLPGVMWASNMAGSNFALVLREVAAMVEERQRQATGETPEDG